MQIESFLIYLLNTHTDTKGLILHPSFVNSRELFNRVVSRINSVSSKLLLKRECELEDVNRNSLKVIPNSYTAFRGIRADYIIVNDKNLLINRDIMINVSASLMGEHNYIKPFIYFENQDAFEYFY